MSFSIELIKEISTHFSGVSKNNTIENVFIDSRKKVSNGLFIPIIGERFDGHDFLLAAIENGAVATMWDESKSIPKELNDNFPVFYVKDTLKALESLSRSYLKSVNPKVIGVTGSNGKTSTKDLIEAVLSKSFKTHKTDGNYNNHIGLPLTILAMPNDSEIAILEMGMNNFGEISFLSKLAKPDIAIITNIGESHIEQLGSREGIAKAKLEITDGLKENGILIIDGDEALLNIVDQSNTIKCGYISGNDYQISELEQKENGTSFTINETEHYFLPLLGKHNVKNSTYAIALGKYLGLSEHTIQIGLESCTLTNMRMEKRPGLNGSMIINDAYNASPTSMRAAIETIKQLNGYATKIVVLGDMYELGKNEKVLHESIADVISAPITHLLTIGEKAKWISDNLLLSNKDDLMIKSFSTKDEAKKELEKLLSSKSVALLKASRGMQFETLANQLYR